MVNWELGLTWISYQLAVGTDDQVKVAEVPATLAPAAGDVRIGAAQVEGGLFTRLLGEAQSLQTPLLALTLQYRVEPLLGKMAPEV